MFVCFFLFNTLRATKAIQTDTQIFFIFIFFKMHLKFSSYTFYYFFLCNRKTMRIVYVLGFDSFFFFLQVNKTENPIQFGGKKNGLILQHK